MNCVCIAMGWTKLSKKLQRIVGEIQTSKNQDTIILYQVGKVLENGCEFLKRAVSELL